MSEVLEVWRDASVGEAREVLVRAGRPIALRVARASDAGVRVRWGELFCARVAEVDRRRRGAFLDLGLREANGFLPIDKDGRARAHHGARFDLRNGQGIVVQVTREAARNKSAIVELVEIGHDGQPPHLLGQHESDEALAEAKPADAQTRGKIDAVIEDALSRTAPIPGGGVLNIEPTAALVAIDVDSGARQGSADPERFALDVNLAAAQEAARQLRLRNLGGIIAIDFIGLRAQAHRAQLEQSVRAAFKDDPWSVQFAPLSRFGVMELARAQLRQPLHEQLRDDDGRLSVETVALMALRAIEREARAAAGRQIACTVAPDVKAWLDAAHIDWRTEISGRIGMRWSLDAAPGPREKIDARAL